MASATHQSIFEIMQLSYALFVLVKKYLAWSQHLLCDPTQVRARIAESRPADASKITRCTDLNVEAPGFQVEAMTFTANVCQNL